MHYIRRGEENPKEILCIVEIEGVLWAEVQLEEFEISRKEYVPQSLQQMGDMRWYYMDRSWKEDDMTRLPLQFLEAQVTMSWKLYISAEAYHFYMYNVKH